MSRYMEDATVQEYSQNYVDVINSPPNGWGQHYCPKTHRTSTEIYMIGRARWGQEFDDAVSNIFRREDA